MKGGFILLNGKFYRDSDLIFTGKDLLRLNYGICESFRAENNLLTFGRENFNFLLDTLSAIGLPVPEEWNYPRFTKDVSRLLNKNHLYLAAKVVIHLIPGNSGTEYLMTAEEIPGRFFSVRDGGLLIGFYDEGAKGSSDCNAYEPTSRALWVMAARTANALTRDNLIILNSNGFACESIGGSFGYLSEQSAIFPSSDAQGYSPPIAQVARSCAEECGYLVQEKKEIRRADLLNANELFLIDNWRGIQPVLGLHARRYYTTGAIAIAAKLGERARKPYNAV